MVRWTEPDQSHVLSVIDRIHAAATDVSGWQGVVDAVSDALGGVAIGLAGGPVEQWDRILHVGAGFREDLAQDYANHPDRWVPANPYLPVVMGAPGPFVDTRNLLADEDVRGTVFYEDWMRPQRLGTGAIGSFRHPSREGPGGGIAVYPTRRSGDLSARQVALLEVFDTHLLRALNTFSRLGHARAERDAFLDALDRLERGVLLVDGQGRVLSANRAGEEILAADDGLAVVGGEIRAARPADTRRLRARVVAAASARRMRPPFLLPRPSGCRAYEVSVSAIRRRLPELSGAMAMAVVFVTDPERRPQPVEAVLQALYGLTPSEAAAAAGLASGLTIREYAEQAERSVETVRTLVKRVFAKTGVRRQAELASLIASGPAALRPDESE